MKKCALILIASALFLACAHTPPRKDLPRSDGNSAEHSRTVRVTIESSPNAAASPYGAQFLDTMIADHEAVLNVEQLAQTRSGNSDLKALVRTMIAKQQAEIKQMRRLREIDAASAPLSVNTDLPGIKDGVLTLDPDKLDLLKEQIFDREFLLEMVRYNEGSLALLTDAGENLNSHGAADDIGAFIQAAANDRGAELEQMKKFQAFLSR